MWAAPKPARESNLENTLCNINVLGGCRVIKSVVCRSLQSLLNWPAWWQTFHIWVYYGDITDVVSLFQIKNSKNIVKWSTKTIFCG